MAARVFEAYRSEGENFKITKVKVEIKIFRFVKSTIQLPEDLSTLKLARPGGKTGKGRGRVKHRRAVAKAAFADKAARGRAAPEA